MLLRPRERSGYAVSSYSSDNPRREVKVSGRHSVISQLPTPLLECGKLSKCTPKYVGKHENGVLFSHDSATTPPFPPLSRPRERSEYVMSSDLFDSLRHVKSIFVHFKPIVVCIAMHKGVSPSEDEASIALIPIVKFLASVLETRDIHDFNVLSPEKNPFQKCSFSILETVNKNCRFSDGI